jgi:uncharacterized protein
MKIVLDTPVLVSGLWKPYSAAGEIVRMMSNAGIRLCFDARILSEYRGVLLCPRFSFDKERIEIFLHQIAFAGDMVAGKPLPTSLSGVAGDIFLEITISGEARRLVTENPRRYPQRVRQGLVVSPGELLELYRREI